MKRWLCLCLSVLMAGSMCAFAGCNGSGGTEGGEPQGPVEPADPVGPGNTDDPGDPVEPGGSEDEPKLKEPVQLVKDPKFANGFGVQGQQDGIGTVFGTIGAEAGKEYSYTWTLAQWYCGYFHKENGQFPEAYDILHATRTQNGSIVNWKDASKTFRVNFDEGSVYMKLEGTKEFTGPRTSSQPWPHILLAYSLQKMQVASLASLRLKMDYTLTTFKDGMTSGLNADLHCAQFPFYVIVSNQNKDSKDHGKYIWFGASLYDNRYQYTMTYAAQDVGEGDKIATNAFVYQPGSKAFMEHPVAVAEPNNVDWDMLPYIKTAFETAQSKGYLVNTAFEDLYVTGGNFGWEITGTYDAAMQVDKFEIWATEYAEEAA